MAKKLFIGFYYDQNDEKDWMPFVANSERDRNDAFIDAFMHENDIKLSRASIIGVYLIENAFDGTTRYTIALV